MTGDPGADLVFMAAALEEARSAAAAGEVPVGAVVTLGPDIIGRGRNAREGRQLATAHAEIMAIETACARMGSWRLEGATLYSTLEPCPMCLGACLNARVRRVVYGAREPKAGACGSVVDLRALPNYNHRLDVDGDVGAEESRRLLDCFFRALRARSDSAPRP